MNKEMRDLLAKIEEKTVQAKAFMSGDNKDVAKANELMDEADALRAEYETAKRVYEAEKANGAIDATEVLEPTQDVQPKSAFEKFGADAKLGFNLDKTMNEGTNADGGYAVPEDVVTKIQEYREAERSLLDLVDVEPVNTNKGARTFKKRSQHTGFSKVGEGQSIGSKATPQFERLTYEIEKYAGYFPVTNEVLADSDSNLADVLMRWIGTESRVTANKLILAEIDTKDAVALTGIDDIKHEINVTIGSAFAGSCKIVTNDDGLNYLDTLKDTNDRYLLAPNPSDVMSMMLSVGARSIPIEVFPNDDMPSKPVYEASTDTTVQSGKTYYTKSGDVYTAVAEPTGNPSTSGYYEVTGYKIPMILGDLKEGVKYFDRQSVNIKLSDVATIGDFNAFEEDLTIYRAIEREDVEVKDDEAFVNGYILMAE